MKQQMRKNLNLKNSSPCRRTSTRCFWIERTRTNTIRRCRIIWINDNLVLSSAAQKRVSRFVGLRQVCDKRRNKNISSVVARNDWVGRLAGRNHGSKSLRRVVLAGDDGLVSATCPLTFPPFFFSMFTCCCVWPPRQVRYFTLACLYVRSAPLPFF